jgi:hypothetical protein
MKTKMQRIGIAGLLLAGVSLFSGCEPEKKIEWVGCPMVSNDDRWTPSQGWLPNVEMGLREDGVVVWRKRESSR